MNEFGQNGGIARNASESEYPGLWRGLAALWCPSAGQQGRKLIDFASRRDATMTGQTWVPGRKGGNALRFAGADYTTNPAVSLGTVHSAMAWVKPNGQTSAFNYGGLCGDSINNCGCLVVKFVGDSAIAYSEGSGEVTFSVPSMTGQWHHIASVRDGLLVSLYLDGRFVGSGSLPGNSPATISTIGARGPIAGVYYVGALDDFRVYTRLLSPQEIMSSYRGASPLVRRRAPLDYSLASVSAAVSRLLMLRRRQALLAA